MGDRGQGSRHELGGGEPDLAGGRLDRAGLQAGAPVVLATRQGQSSQGDRAGADDVTQDQAHLAHVAGREIGDVVPRELGARRDSGRRPFRSQGRRGSFSGGRASGARGGKEAKKSLNEGPGPW